MHGAFIGASKGIGYHAVYLFLQSDPSHTATLLLRKPDITRTDARLGPLVTDGRIRIVQGDATKLDNVAAVLEGADFVLSSVGAAPTIGLTGISLDQPDLCTRSTGVLIEALAARKAAGDAVPRVIAVSSMGIGDNHQHLPLAMRLLYSWLLTKPHLDKLSLEYLLQRASTAIATPTLAENIPPASILAPERIKAIPADFCPEVIIVRPALLVGGDEPVELDGEERMRIAVDAAVYTATRPEVARFIVRECLPGSQGWVNKLPYPALSPLLTSAPQHGFSTHQAHFTLGFSATHTRHGHPHWLDLSSAPIRHGHSRQLGRPRTARAELPLAGGQPTPFRSFSLLLLLRSNTPITTSHPPEDLAAVLRLADAYDAHVAYERAHARLERLATQHPWRVFVVAAEFGDVQLGRACLAAMGGEEVGVVGVALEKGASVRRVTARMAAGVRVEWLMGLVRAIDAAPAVLDVGGGSGGKGAGANKGVPMPMPMPRGPKRKRDAPAPLPLHRYSSYGDSRSRRGVWKEMEEPEERFKAWTEVAKRFTPLEWV